MDFNVTVGDDSESMNNRIHKIFKTVIILLAATLLVVFSFLIAYKAAVMLYPFDSEQELILDYLESPAEMENTIFVAGATMNEISHLSDVAQLMLIIDLIIFPELFVLIILLLIAGQFGIKTIRSTLKLAATGGLSIALILSLTAALFFDKLFEIFHLLLFPQGNFQFSFDSYLIQTLPGEVFFQLGLVIFLLALLINLGYLLTSFLIKRKRKHIY